MTSFIIGLIIGIIIGFIIALVIGHFVENMRIPKPLAVKVMEIMAQKEIQSEMTSK